MNFAIIHLQILWRSPHESHGPTAAQEEHSQQPSFRVSKTSRASVWQWGSNDRRAFYLAESSINGAAQTYRLPLASSVNEEYVTELTLAVLGSSRKQIELLSRERNVKWYLTLSLVFHRASRPDILTDPPVCFRTEPMSLTSCKY